MPVDTPRQDYTDASDGWRRCRDCNGGRDALLRAGNRYVPDLPGADTSHDNVSFHLNIPATGNAAYRFRGNFYNATSRTVQGMSGAIFQEEPSVEFPDAFKEYLDDITLTNVSFEMFAAGAGSELLLIGRGGVLIDMPADQLQQSGSRPNRPYCVFYKAEDIINWRTERRGGDEIVTRVVLCETSDEEDPKDSFVCKVIKQYRVISLDNNICSVQLWRESEKDSKKFVEFGPPTYPMRRGVSLSFIPFVFLGARSPSVDVEKPPLLDLVDVNLAHWRNSVDFEYGLHLVALPTPWVSGAKGAADGKMKIGPSVVWELELQGSAGMLEFTGSGLKAIADAMDDKEQQMAVLGSRLLESEAKVNETASAVRLRHSGEHASLRVVAGAIEAGFTLVLQTVAWWAGTEDTPLDTQVNVELNKDYLDVKATSQEVQVALTALQAGEISFETWWNFLSTGGWAREGVDAAAEQQQIVKEAAVVPEPPVNPDLSPSDIPPAPAPKKKTITGPDGSVKYTITEHP